MPHAPTLPPNWPRHERPAVVQSDGTILLDVEWPTANAARAALATFAHLERSPEYVHTYRLTPLSLWNAAASGVEHAFVEAALELVSRYPLPQLVRDSVRDQMSRFGRAELVRGGPDELRLNVADPVLRMTLAHAEGLRGFWQAELPGGFVVRPGDRGAVKQALVREGYPALDLCGYVDGQPLALAMRATTLGGLPFAMRPYQHAAVDAFVDGGGFRGGAGVIALPCGAGKTVIGMGAMAALGAATLILTTNTLAVRQWRDELLDKTTLTPDDIGEYTGHAKHIRPVTITNYQILTHRSDRYGPMAHLDLMRNTAWGLIIYDEVHMLPAPVFRTTAELQVRRRLGLTATLVREDGMEGDVFALVGPKRFDMSWKVLEEAGYIADASCIEVRVPLGDDLAVRYALASKRDRFRLAAENPRKVELVEELLADNRGEPTLVIGQYIDQLQQIADRLQLPLLTGATPQAERERMLTAFRAGEIGVLVVSKVANFAIDLPDASLAIQVSGAFGSRQEEAQRLGRILRPKQRAARFYSLVSQDTCEQDFAANRQLFLVEQGYRYRILFAQEG